MANSGAAKGAKLWWHEKFYTNIKNTKISQGPFQFYPLEFFHAIVGTSFVIFWVGNEGVRRHKLSLPLVVYSVY